MPVTINGTTGITNPDGTAAAPALTGTDTNTGIFFPAADTIAFAEGGVEAMRINASGNVVMTGTLTTAAQGIAKASLPTGSVLQVVNATYSTYSSSATTIPDDNTIPQNTEGTQIITLAITPTSATNKLLITSVVFATSGSNGSIIANALFQDTTANALAVTSTTASSAGHMITDVMQHYMTSGTSSSTTFKIRAGGHVGTTFFNGNTSARLYNGTGFCSLTIMEIAV